ncbi:MAG: hypothetical protein AAB150_02980, partial [Pseudomonadota bacterium]
MGVNNRRQRQWPRVLADPAAADDRAQPRRQFFALHGSVFDGRAQFRQQGCVHQARERIGSTGYFVMAVDLHDPHADKVADPGVLAA